MDLGLGEGGFVLFATPHPGLSTGQKPVDCSTGQPVYKAKLMRYVADLPYPIILVILGQTVVEGPFD